MDKQSVYASANASLTLSTCYRPYSHKGITVNNAGNYSGLTSGVKMALLTEGGRSQSSHLAVLLLVKRTRASRDSVEAFGFSRKRRSNFAKSHSLTLVLGTDCLTHTICRSFIEDSSW